MNEIEIDLLMQPQHRHFAVDRPEQRQKKQVVIKKFIHGVKYGVRQKQIDDEPIQHEPLLQQHHHHHHHQQQQQSQDSEKQTREQELAELQQKVKELKERKHEYFNLFRSMLAAGKAPQPGKDDLPRNDSLDDLPASNEEPSRQTSVERHQDYQRNSAPQLEQRFPPRHARFNSHERQPVSPQVARPPMQRPRFQDVPQYPLQHSDGQYMLPSPPQRYDQYDQQRPPMQDYPRDNQFRRPQFQHRPPPQHIPPPSAQMPHDVDMMGPNDFAYQQPSRRAPRPRFGGNDGGHGNYGRPPPSIISQSQSQPQPPSRWNVRPPPQQQNVRPLPPNYRDFQRPPPPIFYDNMPPQQQYDQYEQRPPPVQPQLQQQRPFYGNQWPRGRGGKNKNFNNQSR